MKTSDTISDSSAPLPAMNHQEAQRQKAVEKYLLNELTPVLRDQFENHFFDCTECAAELRTTAAFLDEAKNQLGRPGPPPTDKQTKNPWIARLFSPAFASPVFALMLLVIFYQNIGLITGSVEAPEILPATSLITGNSRGGTESPVVVGSGKAILLSVDIPAREEFSSYDLGLISPEGKKLWQVPISAEQAKDTVSIRVPTAHWATGEYRLVVYGRADTTSEQKDLAHYRFKFRD